MGTNKTYSRVLLAGLIFTCHAIFLQPLAHAEPTDEAGQIQRIRQIVLSRTDSPAGVAHLIQLSSKLQPSAAAELYRQLAEEYLRRGRLEKAAEVLIQLVEQYLDQPPALDGLITLVRLYSSSEVAHTAKITVRKTEENSLPVYALYLAQQAMQQQRDLANNPALTFQCAVASRLNENFSAAKSWLSPLKHSRHSEIWHNCAIVETWLQEQRKTPPPKPAIHCSHTDERPLLDGILDEHLWHVAKTQTFADNSTQIKWTRDDKFLYLAIRCRKIAGESYASDKLPRSYDADLAKQDHVRISLDLDRDYATCYHFSVDHRGQTADRCWLDTSWNPRWFVASNSDDTSWTIETAIPWAELTDKLPQPNNAWALSIERQPATGHATAWVGPVAKDPSPASFGLLIFD